MANSLSPARTNAAAVVRTPITDAIRSGVLIPTKDEIIEACLELEPALSLHYRNGDQTRLCSTPVIEAYTNDEGMRVELLKVDGKFGAGYLRVSTISQRSVRNTEYDDSPEIDQESKAETRTEMRGKALDTAYTERDQIRRIVDHFISAGEAFAVFSDAGLSGGWPWNDLDLIRSLYTARAERTYKVYMRLIVDNKRYERHQDGTSRYLSAKIERTIASVEELPEGWAERYLRTGREHNRAKTRTIKFRPGLTALVRVLPQVHCIATADLTRLFRSFDVQSQFGRHIQQRASGCRIIGTIEPLDYLNEDSQGVERFGADLTGYILGRIAEAHLYSVQTGSVNGQLGRLEGGRPINCDVAWLVRDQEDGTYSINTSVAKTAVRAVELYERGYGAQRVMRSLMDDGFDGIPMSGNTIKRWLENPLLVGDQEVYGIVWSNIVPPILLDADGLPDRYRFARIQALKGARGDNHPSKRRTRADLDTHLGAGIATCVCGQSLVWKMMSRQPRTLKNGVVKTYEGGAVYTCLCSLTQMKAKPHHKVTLNKENFEAFIRSLVSDNARYILAALRDSRERDELQEEVATLERTVRERSAALEEKRTSSDAIKKAKEKADEAEKLLGITLTVLQALEGMLAGDKGEVERIEARLSQSRRALASYTLPSEIDRVREQFDRLNRSELSDRDENELVRALMRLEFVDEQRGDASTICCYLRWAVKSGIPIRVPLITTFDTRGHRKIRLPEDGAWLKGKF